MKKGQPGQGGVGANLMAAGMERLLQDESADSYRIGFKILFGIVTFMVLVIAILTAVFVYTVEKGRTGDRYFAMSFEGKKLPLQGLLTPSLNTTAMMYWASQATTEVMTFGFSDINDHIAGIRPYFTDVGYQSFNEAINKSGLVKNIVKNQQIMTAIPAGMATLRYAGMRKGRWVWEIHVPIILTVRAGSQSQSARPDLTITVVRVDTRDNPSGFGIEQWVMF